jgi:hypothetical protein
MGLMHFGPKHLIEAAKNSENAATVDKDAISKLEETNANLQSHVENLEAYLEAHKQQILELQFAPKKIEEKIVEKEVIKLIDVIKHIEVPVYIDREVEKIIHVEKEVEKIVHVDREIPKEMKVIPQYIYGVIAVEALVILGLLLTVLHNFK